MDFSAALRQLKMGDRVYRTEWRSTASWENDWPPMRFIALQQGYPTGIGINKNTAEALGFEEGIRVDFPPYLVLFDDWVCVPWVPTHAELLAGDWNVV